MREESNLNFDVLMLSRKTIKQRKDSDENSKTVVECLRNCDMFCNTYGLSFKRSKLPGAAKIISRNMIFKSYGELTCSNHNFLKNLALALGVSRPLDLCIPIFSLIHL
jgi:hypothetical protein